MPEGLPFLYQSPDRMAQSAWIAPSAHAPHGGVATGQGIVARPAPQEGGQWELQYTTLGQQNPNLHAMWNQGPEFQGATGINPHEQTAQWVFTRTPEQAAPQQAPPPAPTYEDVPAQLPIYDDWDAYRQMARAQTEGLNRMPFVFSDFHKIPTDPQSAFEMFYPGNMQGWQNQLRNPLFESTEVPFSSSGVSQNPNPTQGFGSPFINPMFR